MTSGTILVADDDAAIRTVLNQANNPVGGLSDPWLDYPGGNPFPVPSVFPKDFEFPTSGTYVFESDKGIPTFRSVTHPQALEY